MIYNIQHISKKTGVTSMQKLKLVRSFCLLLALLVGMMPSIASTQTPAMRTDITSLIESNARQDIYCDGTYYAASYKLSDDYETNNPELCSSITVTEIPANVVDWILIELRAVPLNGADPGSTNFSSAVGSKVIARKPGFLLNNGRVVEFSEGDVATAVTDSDLYVVVRHRNHLDGAVEKVLDISDNR